MDLPMGVQNLHHPESPIEGDALGFRNGNPPSMACSGESTRQQFTGALNGLMNLNKAAIVR